MASLDHISDSKVDSDSMDLVHTPKKKKSESTRELSIPGSGLSHRFRKSPTEPPRVRSSTSEESRIIVEVKGPSRPWEYQPIVEEDTVDSILAEIHEPGGNLVYRIEYEDGRRDDVSVKLVCSVCICSVRVFVLVSRVIVNDLCQQPERVVGSTVHYAVFSIGLYWSQSSGMRCHHGNCIFSAVVQVVVLVSKSKWKASRREPRYDAAGCLMCPFCAFLYLLYCTEKR
jgi:hypothetical protein